MCCVDLNQLYARCELVPGLEEMLKRREIDMDWVHNMLYLAFRDGFYWNQGRADVGNAPCCDIEEYLLKPRFDAWMKGQPNPQDLKIPEEYKK